MGDGRVQELNTMNPAAWHAQLGSLIQQMIQGASVCLQLTAIATTTSKIKTAYPIGFEIAGVNYNLAASDNFWTLDTTCNVDQNNFLVVYLYVNAAGAASFGVSNSSGNHGYASLAAAMLNVPAVDQTKALVAMLVLNPTASAFTGGTSAMTVGNTVYACAGGISLNQIPT